MMTTRYHAQLYAKIMALFITLDNARLDHQARRRGEIESDQQSEILDEEDADLAALELDAARFTEVGYFIRLYFAEKTQRNLDGMIRRGEVTISNQNEYDDVVLGAMARTFTPDWRMPTGDGIITTTDDLANRNREFYKSRKRLAVCNFLEGLHDTVLNIFLPATFFAAVTLVDECVTTTDERGYWKLGDAGLPLAFLFNLVGLQLIYIFTTSAKLTYKNFFYPLFRLISGNGESAHWKMLLIEGLKIAALGLAYYTSRPAVTNADETADITGAPDSIKLLMESEAIINITVFNAIGMIRNAMAFLGLLMLFVKLIGAGISWLCKPCKPKAQSGHDDEIDAEAPEAIAHQQSAVPRGFQRFKKQKTPGDYAADTLGMAKRLPDTGRSSHNIMARDAKISGVTLFFMALTAGLAIWRVTATGPERVVNTTSYVNETSCFDGDKNITHYDDVYSCPDEFNQTCPDSNSLESYLRTGIPNVGDLVLFLFGACLAYTRQTLDNAKRAATEKLSSCAISGITAVSMIWMLLSTPLLKIAIALTTAHTIAGNSPEPGWQGITDNLLFLWFMIYLIPDILLNLSQGCQGPATTAEGANPESDEEAAAPAESKNGGLQHWQIWQPDAAKMGRAGTGRRRSGGGKRAQSANVLTMLKTSELREHLIAQPR